MIFNVQSDEGDVIEGYVVLDGFSPDSASIDVALDDGSVVRVPCDRHLPTIRSERHPTGHAGFRIDRSVVPGLADQKRLRIRESKSGFLIYRRRLPDHIPDMKLFRMEMRLIPFARLDNLLGKRFQYHLASADRYGHETTRQVFQLHRVPSIYVAGRLQFRRYESFLDKGYRFIGSIPEPYYEMASRLFVLNRMTSENFSFLSERDNMLLHSAAERVANIDLFDEKALGRALKSMGKNARRVLTSPVTRQLVSTNPDHEPEPKDVVAAIDALSRFTAIGHEANGETFLDAVGELANLRRNDIPVLPRYDAIEKIAHLLRQLPVAESMLEVDLVLDHYVRSAVAPAVKMMDAAP